MLAFLPCFPAFADLLSLYLITFFVSFMWLFRCSGTVVYNNYALRCVCIPLLSKAVIVMSICCSEAFIMVNRSHQFQWRYVLQFQMSKQYGVECQGSSLNFMVSCFWQHTCSLTTIISTSMTCCNQCKDSLADYTVEFNQQAYLLLKWKFSFQIALVVSLGF